MAAVSAVYGKLAKPELGAGGLIIQAGRLDFGSAAATSTSLETQMKTVLGAVFTPQAVTSSVAYCATLAVTAGAITVSKAATAASRYWNYVLVGY